MTAVMAVLECYANYCGWCIFGEQIIWCYRNYFSAQGLLYGCVQFELLSLFLWSNYISKQTNNQFWTPDLKLMHIRLKQSIKRTSLCAVGDSDFPSNMSKSVSKVRPVWLVSDALLRFEVWFLTSTFQPLVLIFCGDGLNGIADL